MGGIGARSHDRLVIVAHGGQEAIGVGETSAADGDRVVVAEQIEGRRNLAGSAVPARLGRPFVGREVELAQVAASFLGKTTGVAPRTSRAAVMVLDGGPGVGKSELAVRTEASCGIGIREAPISYASLKGCPPIWPVLAGSALACRT